LDRKLSLISAPAGFGKSMLLSEWVATLKRNQSEHRVAWVSLDENDNDPARFFSYVVTAVLRADGMEETVGEGLLSMLQSPQAPPLTDILTALINTVAEISDKLIIILDDFHEIEAETVIKAVAFLIENSPPQLHVVIATRDDPLLPLAHLRAQGHMTELRAADLRFLSSEIAQFISQVGGYQLSSDELDALETRSEGWIVGLQLAAVSIQGHQYSEKPIETFSGSHRFVLDYLIEEVLDQQSDKVKSFLLRTSILNRFTSSLCEAVTDQENGQETLQKLERANLFIIPLDDERCWFRYHHLFADALRMRLYQTQAEDEAVLHLRASEWFEQNGNADEAIEHALQAKDFSRAAQLLDDHIEGILQRGEYARTWGWLDAIPDEYVFSKPDLGIASAWYSFASGDLDQAEQNLLAVEKQLRADLPSVSKQTDVDSLLGRVEAVRAFVASYRGDIAGIIRHANLALDLLPPNELGWRSMTSVALGDSYGMTGDMNAAYKARVEALEASKESGDIYLMLISAMKLAVTFRMRGQLQRVIDICQENFALATARGVSRIMVVGWLLAVWAEVLVETNNLDEALNKGIEGVEITKQGDDIAMIGWSQLCLSRILYSRGDLDGADNILRELEGASLEHDMPPFVAAMTSAWRVRLLLARNKLDAANQWVEARSLHIDDEITQLTESMYIVFARVLLAEGQVENAIYLLERLMGMAEAVSRISSAIKILLLQALAFQAKGDLEAALEKIEQALRYAKPGGFVYVFVDEGPALARLLYEIAERNVMPEYVQQLLFAFPTISAGEEADSLKSTTALVNAVEHLSARELDVLELLAEGMSRQDIAAELVLSLNTVKVHVRNIYSKLDVHNQMNAVAKARGLGILERE